MNAEVFAEWLRRQGHRVVRTESSYWFDVQPQVFQSFPYHWVVQPSQQELNDFLRAEIVIALRYSTPVSVPQGHISYHAVVDTAAYSMDSMDRRVRQNIRTGLKHCQVEKITFDRLATEGWLLERDTEARQSRRGAHDEAAWRKRCAIAAELPGFEAWGALVDGRLGASLMTVQIDDWCEMLSQQCDRDQMRNRVNNALTYVVTKTMCERPNIHSIFYAIQSLDAPATIDEFKFRMGYVAKPLRQHVVLHPLIEPFAGVGYAIVKRALGIWPSSFFLAKTAGMLKFHGRGKKPLAEQEWPEILDEHKKRMLGSKHKMESGACEAQTDAT